MSEKEKSNEEIRKPGWNLRGNSDWHAETGRTGGLKTRERGREYYQEIGRRGGKNNAAKTDMKELGRKGGSAKRKPYASDNSEPVSEPFDETGSSEVHSLG